MRNDIKRFYKPPNDECFNELKEVCIKFWTHCFSEHDKDFGYFDEKYPVSADGDMWLKACVGGAKIKMVNHPVGLYYLNPEGNSTKQEKLKEAINEVHNMRSKYLIYKEYVN